MKMTKKNDFYSIKEASGILGIDEKELFKLIYYKEIPVLTVGKTIRISRDIIDNYPSRAAKTDNSKDNGSIEEDLEKAFVEAIPGIDKDLQAEVGGAVLKLEKLKGEYKKLAQEKKELEKDTSKLKKLQEECESLTLKKQELEKDIGQIKTEYKEFRATAKKLVVGELKIFLEKTDMEK